MKTTEEIQNLIYSINLDAVSDEDAEEDDDAEPGAINTGDDGTQDEGDLLEICSFLHEIFSDLWNSRRIPPRQSVNGISTTVNFALTSIPPPNSVGFSSTISHRLIGIRHGFLRLEVTSSAEMASEIETPHQRKRDLIRVKLQRIAFSHSVSGDIEDVRRGRRQRLLGKFRFLLPQQSQGNRIEGSLKGTISHLGHTSGRYLVYYLLE